MPDKSAPCCPRMMLGYLPAEPEERLVHLVCIYCGTRFTPPAPRREDAAGERVAQIAARLNAATPGPWEADVTSSGSIHVQRLGDESGQKVVGGIGYMGAPNADQRQLDAEFIAHSRSDVEYLLAALSTAEREREAAIASLREVHEELYGNASVSLEFALHDLTSKQHHTEKTVGLVREAQESVNLACRALARVPSGGET